MKKMVFVIIAGLLFSASAAIAQSRTPVINERQHKQERRIHEGVRNGELTRGEALQLQRRERMLQYHKRMAKADGVVTKQERMQLQREQDNMSRAIYRKKHNDMVR